MTKLNAEFWSRRYQEGTTGWDLNKVSQPIAKYAESLKDKTQKILIPGAGNAYEAEYLWNKGFKNIYVLDIAEEPLKNLKLRIPHLSEEHLIHANFFHHDDQYDLILEQTFFCALEPSLRVKYKDHTHRLLKPNAQVAGLLFDFPLGAKGPPFGGDKDSYWSLFSDRFKIKILERCYNSEPSRRGKELFFIFEKK